MQSTNKTQSRLHFSSLIVCSAILLSSLLSLHQPLVNSIINKSNLRTKNPFASISSQHLYLLSYNTTKTIPNSPSPECSRYTPFVETTPSLLLPPAGLCLIRNQSPVLCSPSPHLEHPAEIGVD